MGSAWGKTWRYLILETATLDKWLTLSVTPPEITE